MQIKKSKSRSIRVYFGAIKPVKYAVIAALLVVLAVAPVLIRQIYASAESDTTITSHESVPASVQEVMADVKKVYNGSTTFAIKNDNTLWGWGDNQYGRLGINSTENQLTPIKLMDEVEELYFMDFASFALKTEGTLWVWGRNYNGLLGIGSVSSQATPVKVLDGVRKVYTHCEIDPMFNRDCSMFAIKTDNTLWAWGSGDLGQFADGGSGQQNTPKKILDDIKEFYSDSAWPFSAFVLKTDNTLWAWGDNPSGQLGNGTTTDQATPVKVLDDVKEFNLSSSSSFALKTDNTLWSWGNNSSGQLGNGTITNQLTPVQVLADVKKFYVSSSSSFALKTDNTLWAWGSNGRGQLGNSTNVDQPSPVKTLDGVDRIYLTKGSNFALKTDNTLWGWGRNGYGDLGNGNTNSQLTPIRVMNDVKEFYGTENWDSPTFALKTDNTLWGWGDNRHSILGDGVAANQPAPIKVLDGVREFYYSIYNPFAIKDDNTLWSWGNNSSGQLGNGTTDNQLTPVTVLGAGGEIQLPQTGSKDIALTLDSAGQSQLRSWRTLRLTNRTALPDGATITYSLMDATCTTPIAGFENLTLDTDIDISSLATDTYSWCVRVNYTNVHGLDLVANMSFERHNHQTPGNIQGSTEVPTITLAETGIDAILTVAIAGVTTVVGGLILRRVYIA